MHRLRLFHDIERTHLAISRLSVISNDSSGNKKYQHEQSALPEYRGSKQAQFDYRLRPGPCPTTNALRIMALEGLPVPEGKD
jgi:hypothetical protein